MDDLFNKFLKAVDYQIQESDKFDYPMYPNARYMCGSTEDCFGALGCHFNAETHEVYELIANSETKWTGEDVAYRWMHPDYREAARLYYAKTGDPDTFCGETPYIELDDPEDCLSKGASLIAGDLEYDTRVVMSLDVTEEEAELFRRAAEIRGISLDLFVEEALIKAIESIDPATALHFRNKGLGVQVTE